MGVEMNSKWSRILVDFCTLELSSLIYLFLFKKIYLFVFIFGCVGSLLLCTGFL